MLVPPIHLNIVDDVIAISQNMEKSWMFSWQLDAAIGSELFSVLSLLAVRQTVLLESGCHFTKVLRAPFSV